jgi:hypothetical protein
MIGTLPQYRDLRGGDEFPSPRLIGRARSRYRWPTRPTARRLR